MEILVQPDALKGKTTRVKFCRIRHAFVLREMANLGVDFAGLHLINRISTAGLSDAAELCRYALDLGVEPVLLTKVESIDLIVHAMQVTGARWLQLHRLWQPEELAALRTGLNNIPRPISLIHLINSDMIDNNKYIQDIMSICEFLIIDHERGGTGRPLPPFVLRRLFNLIPRERIFIAGGLTATNVGELVRTYRPAAVDVQSGVIGKDREHDPVLMSAFVTSVRAVQTGAVGGDASC